MKVEAKAGRIVGEINKVREIRVRVMRKPGHFLFSGPLME